MSLCTLLKQLRERQRLRVADVATLLDVSKSAIYAWESGENEPAPAQLLALANAYNATKRTAPRLPGSRRLDRTR